MKEQIESVFAENVFNDCVMKEKLPAGVYAKFEKTLHEGEPLDPGTADIVARAMKDWAMEKGAVHYTHWFQPMTGNMAEKHVSFLERNREGKAFADLSGKMLVKGEPDASSFPTGGMRSTFEARGYTAWDPTSPAFIMDNGEVKTLCLPSFFFSYTGAVLDRKLPLIRSTATLSEQAFRILNLFGDKKTKKVEVQLGIEQEFFLLDKSFYHERLDLKATGRTLFGRRPPKGQDLHDHYFGSIPKRVLSFMADAENRLLKLGVPVKARHNEVAPSQFEMAPIFENANIAVDHNMLMMEVLRQTAGDHGLVCLLHEKPFQGVNGSGKHNNYSISAESDEGSHNLFEPGDTPMENAQFIVFLGAFLRAIHCHNAAVRIGAVCPGNDQRLGGNEAPPAIISVFIGSELLAIVDAIIAGEGKRQAFNETVALGVSTLPPLPKDTSDRNRTSPVAFTGNKFEFRMPGSSQSPADSTVVLNLAMADALKYVADTLEEKRAKGQDLKTALQGFLPELLKAHRDIIYHDDCYSDAWKEEAARRKIPNLKTNVQALSLMDAPEVLGLLTRFGTFTEREVRARREILLETYCTTIVIEGTSCLYMGRSMILPAAIRYQGILAETIQRTVAAAQNSQSPIDLSGEQDLLAAVSHEIAKLKKALDVLEDALKEAENSKEQGTFSDKANHCHNGIVPAMNAARQRSDTLEGYVDDALWPIPKYSEMLKAF